MVRYIVIKHDCMNVVVPDVFLLLNMKPKNKNITVPRRRLFLKRKSVKLRHFSLSEARTFLKYETAFELNLKNFLGKSNGKV